MASVDQREIQFTRSEAGENVCRQIDSEIDVLKRNAAQGAVIPDAVHLFLEGSYTDMVRAFQCEKDRAETGSAFERF